MPGTAVSGWQQCLAALSLERDDGIQSGRCQDPGPGRAAARKAVQGSCAPGNLSHGDAARLCGGVALRSRLSREHRPAEAARSSQGSHQHLPLPSSSAVKESLAGTRVPRQASPGTGLSPAAPRQTQALAARSGFTGHWGLFFSKDTRQNHLL